MINYITTMAQAIITSNIEALKQQQTVLYEILARNKRHMTEQYNNHVMECQQIDKRDIAPDIKRDMLDRSKTAHTRYCSWFINENRAIQDDIEHIEALIYNQIHHNEQIDVADEIRRFGIYSMDAYIGPRDTPSEQHDDYDDTY